MGSRQNRQGGVGYRQYRQGGNGEQALQAWGSGVENFSPECVERAEFFLLCPPVFVIYLYFLCFYLFFNDDKIFIRREI